MFQLHQKKTCYSKSVVEVRHGESVKAQLQLKPSERTPAQSELSGIQCACAKMPCPCQPVQNTFSPPPQVMMPYPWWLYYGNQFSYFYYPGPWYQHGILGRYYPGDRNVSAMKPIVYFRGKYAGDIHLKVKLVNEGANLLSTAPQYSADGWRFRIDKDSRIWRNLEYSLIFFMIIEMTIQHIRTHMGNVALVRTH